MAVILLKFCSCFVFKTAMASVFAVISAVLLISLTYKSVKLVPLTTILSTD